MSPRHKISGISLRLHLGWADMEIFAPPHMDLFCRGVKKNASQIGVSYFNFATVCIYI